jgi:hypothetical protein
MPKACTGTDDGNADDDPFARLQTFGRHCLDSAG